MSPSGQWVDSLSPVPLQYNLSVRANPALSRPHFRGGKPMQTHKSSRLTGPSRRTRAWWHTHNRSPRPEVVSPLPETALPDDDQEFRADLVAQVRRQIADGTYGTEEQWEIALERLLRHLDQMG